MKHPCSPLVPPLVALLLCAPGPGPDATTGRAARADEPAEPGAAAAAAEPVSPGFKSAAARRAVAEFDGKIKRLDGQFAEALAGMRAKYDEHHKTHLQTLLAELDAELLEATKRGELDEALGLRSARLRLAARAARPPGGLETIAASGDKAKSALLAPRGREPSAARGANTSPRGSAPPAQAIAFGGHRYLVVETPATWHAAQRLAAEQGGHLVRVDSPVEQQFVHRLISTSVGESYWIDASDELKEGHWITSDGQPLAFANWDATEPSNYDNREHSAMTRRSSGKWHDTHGSQRLPCVLEWDE